jgi:hypothetical protein
MIRTKEDFYRIVQARIVPIYFFDSKSLPSINGKFTVNGTLTLFKKREKIFGITNLHVYEQALLPESIYLKK